MGACQGDGQTVSRCYGSEKAEVSTSADGARIAMFSGGYLEYCPNPNGVNGWRRKGCQVTEDGSPVAYSALKKGLPVVSQSGRRFGTLERVIADPQQDILHGMVVATVAGHRFVARDAIDRMTTTKVTCSLTDEQVAALPTASTAALGRLWKLRKWSSPRL